MMVDMNEVGRRTLLEVEKYARGDDGSAQELFRVTYSQALLEAFTSAEDLDDVSIADVYLNALASVRTEWPDFIALLVEGSGPSGGLGADSG